VQSLKNDTDDRAPLFRFTDRTWVFHLLIYLSVFSEAFQAPPTKSGKILLAQACRSYASVPALECPDRKPRTREAGQEPAAPGCCGRGHQLSDRGDEIKLASSSSSGVPRPAGGSLAGLSCTRKGKETPCRQRSVLGPLSLALTLTLLTSGGATTSGLCTTRYSRTEVEQWTAPSQAACCDQTSTVCSDGVPRTGNSFLPNGGVAVKCG
jgi:hypothetical protein